MRSLGEERPTFSVNISSKSMLPGIYQKLDVFRISQQLERIPVNPYLAVFMVNDDHGRI